MLSFFYASISIDFDTISSGSKCAKPTPKLSTLYAA